MRAEAYRIYQELSERSLSPPLTHFVQFKLAYSEWQNGDYDKSLQRIRNVMQGQEHSASNDDFRALKEKVILDWAKVAFQSQDYAKVVQLYQEDPFVFDTQKSLEVVAMVAESYERLQYFPNALPLYETLLKNDPKDRWRMKTALCLFETGQVARAEQLLNQVSDPALTAEKAELLGRVAFSTKRYVEAMKHFERQIEALGGDNAVPTATLIQYSRCLLEQGRHEAALPWIEKALQRLPRENAQDRIQVLLMAGRCYQKLGRHHEAIATYESLLPEVSSEDLRNHILYELSNLYLQAGQPDKAEAKLSELLTASKEFWKLAARQKMDYIRIRQEQSGLF
jgi:tetratricopeptide (TPR) repeat protein